MLLLNILLWHLLLLNVLLRHLLLLHRHLLLLHRLLLIMMLLLLVSKLLLRRHMLLVRSPCPRSSCCCCLHKRWRNRLHRVRRSSRGRGGQECVPVTAHERRHGIRLSRRSWGAMCRCVEIRVCTCAIGVSARGWRRAAEAACWLLLQVRRAIVVGLGGMHAAVRSAPAAPSRTRSAALCVCRVRSSSCFHRWQQVR